MNLPAGQEEFELGNDPACQLVAEGFRNARAISHPLLFGRHLWAWAHRLSALDPTLAAAWAEGLAERTETGDEPIRLMMNVCRDAAKDPEAQDLPALFARTTELARALPPEGRLRVLNELCEAAISLAEKDREAAVALMLPLAAEVRSLENPDTEFQQNAALGCALIGEALLALDRPEGRELLAEAERHCQNLLDPDPIRLFLANSFSAADPLHAADLADQLLDSGSRMDVRLQIVQRTEDPALRERLFEAAERDAAMVEHMRGPEALVRMGEALAALDAERARSFFRRAWESAQQSGGHQLRSLQWTGIASALAGVDREWAGTIFQDALSAAREAEDPLQRVVSLIVIADEMAEPYPQEAAAVFQEAVTAALNLQEMWQFVHVLDVVFRAERSPYLDLAPVKPVLEEVLRRTEADDLRVPGVFGLPDAARLMLQVDPARAQQSLQAWYDQSLAAQDVEGLLQSALAIHQTDPETARRLLRETADYLRERVDCPAMGEYSRSVAPVAPELVVEVAAAIPDRRERAEAFTAAAVALWNTDPEQALSLVRALERPVDRSYGFLDLADHALSLHHRPIPPPLLEELP